MSDKIYKLPQSYEIFATLRQINELLFNSNLASHITAGAFDYADYATRHYFAVLLCPHDRPGLSAFCLQTRLSKESRLRRALLANLNYSEIIHGRG